METLTAEEWQCVKEIFDDAAQAGPLRQKDVVAAADLSPIARSTLESMLEAVGNAPGFLDRPASSALLETPKEPVVDLLPAGARIGKYRVVRFLGSGGSGEVYLAERSDGLYEQQVALKRLLTTAARVPHNWTAFNAERQILARLDHPSIARLLDAGVDDEARPYTVVEYVQGSAFLDHCSSLALRERLQCFLQICEAVAYAHAQLVIHRDIKPGNLMVNADGRAKLLDFGIARLTDTDGLGHEDGSKVTPFTREYAAPEQIDGRPASTGTDVFQLGLVLFELLTARRPWSLGDIPLSLAAERLLHLDAPQASRLLAGSSNSRLRASQVAGDLDAIIAKALQKDPLQRYPSVEALAEDIRRHLRGEPVRARAGSRFYVAGRFVTRHRWPLAASVLLVGALVAAVGIHLAARQRQADLRIEFALREMRRGDALNDLLALLLRSGSPGAEAVAANPREVLKQASERVFDQFKARPAALADVVVGLSDIFIAADDTESAGTMLERYLDHFAAGADPANLAAIRNALATVAIRRGDIPRAADLLQQAQAFWNADSERYREDLLSSRINQAAIERGQGHAEQAIETLRGLLETRMRHPGGRDSTLVIYQNLASALTASNRLDESAKVLDEGWSTAQSLGQTHTPEGLSLLGSRAVYSANRGDLDEAERRYRECASLRRELYGDSVMLAAALNGLGRALALKGQVAEALPLLEQAREMAARFAGAKSLVVVASLLFEADAHLIAGEQAAAEAAILRARAIGEGQYGPEHPLALRIDEAEGRLRVAQGRADEAAARFDTAEAGFRKLGDPGMAFLAQALVSHAELKLEQGQAGAAVPMFEEAAALRARFAAPSSWLRAEADAGLGAALIANQARARGMPLLTAAVNDLQRLLGADHPVTRQAQRWLQHASSLAADQPGLARSSL